MGIVLSCHIYEEQHRHNLWGSWAWETHNLDACFCWYNSDKHIMTKVKLDIAPRMTAEYHVIWCHEVGRLVAPCNATKIYIELEEPFKTTKYQYIASWLSRITPILGNV